MDAPSVWAVAGEHLREAVGAMETALHKGTAGRWAGGAASLLPSKATDRRRAAPAAVLARVTTGRRWAAAALASVHMFFYF